MADCAESRDPCALSCYSSSLVPLAEIKLNSTSVAKLILLLISQRHADTGMDCF